MAKKIQIDIEVNGKMQKATVSAKKLAAALDGTEKSARTADRNLKGLSQQSANGTKNFSKMAQGMTGTLVPAYATLAANVFAITALFSALKTAADYRVIRESQIAFASATGVGLRTLTNDIKSATDGLVGFAEASQAAAIGTASGLNTDQIENLAEGAKNVSLILGRDVTDSFNRLIRGVTKAEPELLDELGITLRLTDATEKYAASLNKAAKDLTLYEKSQAVAVEVQSQLDEKYASVAAAVDLQSNSIARLGTEFEKILNPIKSFVSFLTEPTAEFLADNIKALTAAFALLAIPILKSIIPGLEDWAATSEQSATAAAEAIKNTKNEIEALKQAQVELRQTGADAGKSAREALSGVKAKKGTGIDLIKSGQIEKLTKRQITSLRVAAEAGRGAVTKMSDAMRRQYIAALREMEGKTVSTTQKIKTDFARTKRSLVLSFKQIGAQWDLLMARMKKAGARASKFLNKAMRFAGIFGVLMLLKDLLVEIAKKLGFGDQRQEVLDLAEDFKAVTEQLKTTTKEFSKFATVQQKFFEKSGSELQTLEQLGAIGNYIDSNTKSLTEALDVVEKYNNFIAATPGELDAVTVAQDKLTIAQKNIDDQLALRERMKLTGEYTKQQLNGFNQTEAQKNAVIEAQKELDKAEAAAAARRNEVMADQKEGFQDIVDATLTQTNVTKRLEETQKQVKTSAQAMAAGLRAAKIETQEGGGRFLELIDILATTGSLTEENRNEFQELSDKLVGVGASAKIAAQQLVELERQFSTKLSSITSFSTSVTTLISNFETLQAQFAEGGELRETKGAIANFNKIGEILKTLNQIRDMEIKKQLRSLQIENAKASLMVGATSLEKEQINRMSKLLELENSRQNLITQLTLAQEEGVEADENKIKMLELQLGIIDSQEEALNRQRDILLDTIDKMEDAFEKSFESGLADLIKGKETSLKEAVAKIATASLEAAADNMAKNITRQLFGIEEKDPAKEMEAAMIAGGNAASTATKNSIETAGAKAAQDMKTAITQGGTAAAQALSAAIGGKSVADPSLDTSGFSEVNTINPKYLTNQGAAANPLGALTMGPSLDSLQNPAQPMTNMASPMGTGYGLTDHINAMTMLPTVPTGGNTLTLGEDEKGGLSEAMAGLRDSIGELTIETTSNITAGAALVAGLTGNSKAAEALAKITAALKAYQMIRAGIEKFLGIKRTTETGALIIALNANTLSNYSSAASGVVPFGRHGGIMKEYATGGIARGKNAGYPAILHGTEAVVPLPNGNSIPVEMRNGGQSVNNVTVNVSTDGQTQSSSNGAMGENLGQVIAAAVHKELHNQKRAGGILNKHGAA